MDQYPANNSYDPFAGNSFGDPVSRVPSSEDLARQLQQDIPPLYSQTGQVFQAPAFPQAPPPVSLAPQQPAYLNPATLLGQIQNWDVNQLADLAGKLTPLLVYKQYYNIFRTYFAQEKFIVNLLTGQTLMVLGAPAPGKSIPYILAPISELEAAYADPNLSLEIKEGNPAALRAFLEGWVAQLESQHLRSLSGWVSWLTGVPTNYRIDRSNIKK